MSTESRSDDNFEAKRREIARQQAEQRRATADIEATESYVANLRENRDHAQREIKKVYRLGFAQTNEICDDQAERLDELEERKRDSLSACNCAKALIIAGVITGATAFGIGYKHNLDTTRLELTNTEYALIAVAAFFIVAGSALYWCHSGRLRTIEEEIGRLPERCDRIWQEVDNALNTKELRKYKHEMDQALVDAEREAGVAPGTFSSPNHR